MADQLLIKMSATLTNIFFTRWNDIFKVRNSKRSIKDELKIEAVIEKCKESDSYNETTEETFYYLSIKRMENTNLYKISQRSLGFRWFLSFILFTEIPAAVNKDKKLIFLLDEPAANLHSSAQEQILKSFKYMAQRGHQIIYSTHSQYLIDPNLLENAYVCRNETFNYTTKALYSYDSTYANITIAPYRQFVNKSPNKTTYFQPVLDILEVRPSKIEDITNAVIMEGKTDFYIINYFKAIFFPDQYLAFSIVPGKGADKLDDIVRLYLAWGKKFLIVVDGDDEGKKVAKEYKVNYLLSDEEILTLTDINPSWIKIESLVSGVDKNKYNLIKKKQIDLFFQEALYTKKRLNLSEETSNNFKILLEFFKNKFSSYE
jgi:predicted ATP-dependent endonuclease of OLD family